MRARSIIAFLLVAAVAFGLGVVAADRLWLQPERVRLESEATNALNSNEQARAGASWMSAQWNVQLYFMSSRPEPAGAATEGVYLAKITGIPGHSDFIADWESTDGVRSPTHNRYDYRQRVSFMPLGSVWVQRPVGKNFPGQTGPQPAQFPDFFSELSTNTPSGKALREAHWWVTLEGGACVELVQAPASSF